MNESMNKGSNKNMYHNMNIKRTGKKEVLKRNYYDKMEYLTFPALEATGLVRHLFTTRLGGVSEGIFGSLNLSYTRGDEKEAVDENYQRVARTLGCAMEDFVCSDQTHTTNVRKVTSADKGKGVIRRKDYTDVDALITNEAGLVLATFYADCVPLFIVDPVTRAIGLAHSGWRGTVGRMGACTLQAMQEAYGTKPEDAVVAIGPSICQDCYEVSENVAEQFVQEFGAQKQKDILLAKGNGKYQLNLWKANESVFLDAGVRKEQISVTDICTCCNPEYLFSHRASQGKRGNLGAFMGLL